MAAKPFARVPNAPHFKAEASWVETRAPSSLERSPLPWVVVWVAPPPERDPSVKRVLAAYETYLQAKAAAGLRRRRGQNVRVMRVD